MVNIRLGPPPSIVVLHPTGYSLLDTNALKNAGTTKGVFTLASGTWAVQSNSIVIGSDCNFVCQGSATIINTVDDNGPTFQFAEGCQRAGIWYGRMVFEDMTDTSVNTTSTQPAIQFSEATTSTSTTKTVDIYSVDITGYNIAIYAPWTDGTSINYSQYYNLWIGRIRLRACNIGLFFNGFSDSEIWGIDASNLFAGSLGNYQTDAAPPGGAGTQTSIYSLATQNFICDLGNSIIEKIEVFGGPGTGIAFQNCVTTHIKKCESGNTGIGVAMMGCTASCELQVQASLNSLYGVYLDNCTDLILIDGWTNSNQWHGVYAVSTSYVNVYSWNSINNGQAGAGSYDGFNIQGQNWVFYGGDVRDTQATPTQRYGINGNNSGSNYIYAHGTVFGGTTSTPSFICAGTFYEATDCPGLNYQGFATTTPGLPLVNTFVANSNPYSVEVYTNGTGISVKDLNGTTSALGSTGSPNPVTLRPNEEIEFTSLSPTAWIWKGL